MAILGHRFYGMASGIGSHCPDRPGRGHTLAFKPDQLMGVGQPRAGSWGNFLDSFSLCLVIAFPTLRLEILVKKTFAMVRNIMEAFQLGTKETACRENETFTNLVLKNHFV